MPHTINAATSAAQASAILPELLPDVLTIARDAGAGIMHIYNRDDGQSLNITDKADASPLTEADLAAHNIIVKGLEKLTPQLPILSEESASIPWATRKQWRTYWLVDPLDGTKEFIKRNGEFTVNIALIADGVPVLGAVYVPVQNRMYYGMCGGTASDGAWLTDGDAAPKAISVTKPAQQPPRVMGSRSHRRPEEDAYLAKLGEHSLVSVGSSLKFCLIAEGRADVYARLGLTSEWDTGAGQAVMQGAGGHVTTMDMAPMRYNTKDNILNPHFFVFGDDEVKWNCYL